jgi:hypothetical protein
MFEGRRSLLESVPVEMPVSRSCRGNATVVRFKDGEMLVTDGPYAEGKECLGGFTIVDVADLDAALEVARRMAEIITLPIEVRPFRDLSDSGRVPP